MSFCANEKTLPQWRKGAMHLENVQIAGSDWLQSHILRLHHVILCWPKAVSLTHLQIRKRMPSHQACIETWTALLVCHLGVGTNIYQLISQHVKIFQYVNVSSRCILYILPAWEVDMQSNARNSCTPKNLKIKAAKATKARYLSASHVLDHVVDYVVDHFTKLAKSCVIHKMIKILWKTRLRSCANCHAMCITRLTRKGPSVRSVGAPYKYLELWRCSRQLWDWKRNDDLRYLHVTYKLQLLAGICQKVESNDVTSVRCKHSCKML